jgi:hypothetical protein
MMRGRMGVWKKERNQTNCHTVASLIVMDTVIIHDLVTAVSHLFIYLRKFSFCLFSPKPISHNSTGVTVTADPSQPIQHIIVYSTYRLNSLRHSPATPSLCRSPNHNPPMHKGYHKGSLPMFINIGNGFRDSTVDEDSILNQLRLTLGQGVIYPVGT